MKGHDKRPVNEIGNMRGPANHAAQQALTYQVRCKATRCNHRLQAGRPARGHLECNGSTEGVADQNVGSQTAHDATEPVGIGANRVQPFRQRRRLVWPLGEVRELREVPGRTGKARDVHQHGDRHTHPPIYVTYHHYSDMSSVASRGGTPMNSAQVKSLVLIEEITDARIGL